MRTLLLGAAVLLSLGCKARGTGSPVNEAVALDRPPEIPGYVFVGCRPNVGECYNSCADHRFFPQNADSEFCESRVATDGPYECHCLVGDGTNDGPGDEPPEY